MVLSIIFLIELGLIITGFLLAKDKYREIIKEGGAIFQLAFMAPISLYIIEKFNLIELFSRNVNYIHHNILILYGNKRVVNYTKLFIAQIISASLITIFISTFFGMANNDPVIIYFGLFLAAVIPLILIKSLDKSIQNRKEEIILELPEFLNKVILLVNAGETVQKAIIRSVEQKKEPEKSYLYRELLLSVNELKNNESLSRVLESFSKRCSVHEVSIFTTTVLLNYRRGGNDFILALQALAKDLWEKRKALARTLGEQASSKLVFPMVLIFLVVLIVIATPAFMMF